MADIHESDLRTLAHLKDLYDALKKAPREIAEWNIYVRNNPPRPFGWRKR